MTRWVPLPGPGVLDALDVVNSTPDGELAAVAALAEVTELVRGHTRGRGFRTITTTVDDEESTQHQAASDLVAVIVLAAARLAPNGAQLSAPTTAGEFGETRRGSFAGWTLAERLVLDRWRQRMGIA